jgi:hypothetical protein
MRREDFEYDVKNRNLGPKDVAFLSQEPENDSGLNGPDKNQAAASASVQA